MLTKIKEVINNIEDAILYKDKIELEKQKFMLVVNVKGKMIKELHDKLCLDPKYKNT